MALIISAKVRAKLAAKAPPVTQTEIEQCRHRKLKVVFIPQVPDVVIRTAYDPNPTEMNIYDRHARRPAK